MVVVSLGTGASLGLSILFMTSIAFASNFDAAVCDGAADVDTSELNLLQKRAQVIRKPVAENPSLLTTDAIKITTDRTAAVKFTTNRTGTSVCSIQMQHSKTSAFVIAMHGRVVPLSQKQRLSMLSTTQVSGLSEAGNRAVIAACAFVVLLTAAVTLVLALIEIKFSQIFTEIVKEGIEIVANDILGLNVTIGSMVVGVLKGSVMITDFNIANPPEWKTDCFLNANTIDIRLNLWGYVWKRFFGRPFDVEVDSIVFKDLGLNVEKSASASNVQAILAMVQENKDKLDRTSTSPTKGKKEHKLILHKMKIEDATATVPFWGHIAMPSVHCKDFDKATEGKAKTLPPIVVEILRELSLASAMVVDEQQDKSVSIVA